MRKKRLFPLLLIMFFVALLTNNVNAQETTKGENIVISGRVNYSPQIRN